MLSEATSPTDIIGVETEKSIFSLNNDYFSTLIYFESENIMDEQYIKNLIRKIETLSEHILNIYVLNGQRKLLIVAKNKNDTSRIEASILNIFKETYTNLKRISIPFTTTNNKNSQPILLCGEISESELHFFSDDRNLALNMIQNKTGLIAKTVKQTGIIYLTGLLFQFLILNELLNENNENKVLGEISQNLQVERKINQPEINVNNNVEKSSHSEKAKNNYMEWSSLYEESEIKGYYRIKPKQENEGENNMPDIYYDIYIFNADLTNLNTDGLVNAANPNLHPGYIGDGIARRIREKGGKQMQDACKRIIRQENDNQLIKEGEVVLTKASGKLKSKYVLHAVAPTWTKHIMNNIPESRSSSPTSSQSSMASSLTSSPTSSTSSTSTGISEKFEYLMEKTFTNILKQAHDPKLQLNSISLPVSSNSLGGAFDLPVELCAHSLYTQLCDYKIDKSTNLKTFCITSLETETVQTMCEIFSNYIDNYTETSWAMPLSPMVKLVNIAYQNKAIEEAEVHKNKLDAIKTENFNFNSEENLTKNNKDTESNSSKVIDEVSIEKSGKFNSETLSDRQLEPRQIQCKKNDAMNTLNNELDKLTVTIQINNEDKNKENSNSRLITMDENTITHIKHNRQNKARTDSNCSTSSYSSEGGSFDKNRLNFSTRSDSVSSGTGSMPNQTTNYFKALEMNSKLSKDSSCLFCQRENKNQLVACGNEDCKGVYCQNCILNYFKNQKTQKCPSCRLNIQQEIKNNSKERYSSSPDPVKLMSIQHKNLNSGVQNTNNDAPQNQNTGFNYNRLKFNGNSNNSSPNNSNHSINSPNNNKNLNVSNVKHAITQAKVYVRVMDEPCDGYEKCKTLMITFEVEDGIQNANHPRPSIPFKGTIKKVYLPEVPEHREILSFYEKALHSGRLFKIAFSRAYDDYRVLLNQDVLLKTSQHNGGRFGYPDFNYVKDILYMARNCK